MPVPAVKGKVGARATTGVREPDGSAGLEVVRFHQDTDAEHQLPASLASGRTRAVCGG